MPSRGRSLVAPWIDRLLVHPFRVAIGGSPVVQFDAMSKKGRRPEGQLEAHHVAVQQGESILMIGRPSIAVVWPKYLLTLGLYSMWRKRNVSVLTDRRVLVGKGILSRSEHSIPIREINDVTYVRKGLSAYCEVASMFRGRDRVERLGPLSSRQARRMADELRARH